MLFFLQLFLSDLLAFLHIRQNTCCLFCFVFSSFYGLLVVLLCSRTWYTLAFHLLYLDELRLFGLLCFTLLV